jgi:spore coat protein U-like protein
MTIKKLFNYSVLGLALCASSAAMAANSASSGSIPISLTIIGSCTIDTSATNGTFSDSVVGIASSPTKNTTVSVNCTNTMPFKLGVDGGLHYTTTRNLSDGVHTDIAYSVQQAGAPFGDADIVNYDPTYVPTSTENAYSTTGTGASQAISVAFVATQPASQASGTYTDSVKFVVAWP